MYHRIHFSGTVFQLLFALAIVQAVRNMALTTFNKLVKYLTPLNACNQLKNQEKIVECRNPVQPDVSMSKTSDILILDSHILNKVNFVFVVFLGTRAICKLFCHLGTRILPELKFKKVIPYRVEVNSAEMSSLSNWVIQSAYIFKGISQR